MSPRTKELLKRAAEHEHRTLTNMLEVLIFEHCKRTGLDRDQHSVLPSTFIEPAQS